MVAEREPLLLDSCARPRVHGEDDHLVDPVQAVHDPPEPRLLDVRLPVDRHDDVRARARAAPGSAARAIGAKMPARVGHHVADDVDPAHDALVLQRPARTVVRAEEEPGEAVGLDPVVLLRHREVAASKPRLDVRERDRRVGGSARAGERRVRVAVDEDEVRRLGGDPLRDRGLHHVDVGGVQVEAVPRLGEAELVEEDLGHDVEPVLARVQHDLVHRRPRAAPRRAAPP